MSTLFEANLVLQRLLCNVAAALAIRGAFSSNGISESAATEYHIYIYIVYIYIDILLREFRVIW